MSLSYRLKNKFLEEVLTLSADTLDSVIEWINTVLEPQDVFKDDVLEQWAYDNGFKKFE